ncbi:hypothetical protein ZOSMA_600G00020 [Zostera marina]|uniref:Uncharacterized protein n=2 Tax=Zostera marina TaxID=29655 RepID=A0A0K9NTP1_ZOSMR|nr:hypothetical protein ZOSMA_600G00020 [Zostera marina]
MIFDSKTFTLLIFYVFKLYKLSNFLFTLSTYQEFKWHQVRDKLQAAQASSEMARNIYEQLNTEQKQKETTLFPGMQQITSESQHMSGEKENSTSMIYNHHELHSIRTVDDKLKSTAAAMAAKLAASTSSAEMLSSLLSTLASEGVIGHQNRENHSVDNLKRIKLDNGMPSFMSNHSQFSQPKMYVFEDGVEFIKESVMDGEMYENELDTEEADAIAKSELQKLQV